MIRPILISSFFSFASAATAEVPSVVTDIAPVQSLVAQVMGELGQPDLLIPTNSSPHSFALRPSQVSALEGAAVVFWVGGGLTPWLEPMLERVAGGAKHVSLLELPETHTLAFENEEEHADGEDDDHDDDGHDDDDHDDEHEEDHDGHHHHGNFDPHAWLDPDNALVWLKAIAAELATLDPENATTYQANAQSAAGDLAKTVASIEQMLEPSKSKSFITFHDAYRYFEHRFGLNPSAAISLGDATAPSPARVDRIRTYVLENNVSCAFKEPQYSGALIDTVLEGTTAGVAELDPLGVALETGPELYPNLLRDMAEAIAGC